MQYKKGPCSVVNTQYNKKLDRSGRGREQTLQRNVGVDHVVGKGVLDHVFLLLEEGDQRSVDGLVIVQVWKHGETRVRQIVLGINVHQPSQRILTVQEVGELRVAWFDEAVNRMVVDWIVKVY